MAQEYVPGTAVEPLFRRRLPRPDKAADGPFRASSHAHLSARFRQQLVLRSIPLAEMSTAAVDSIVESRPSLDYRGIFSAEFKRDARNGEFSILEVNTRAWRYVEFAARCGVNVCAMAYEDALDLRSRWRRGAICDAASGCVDLHRDMSCARAAARRAIRCRKILWQWARAHWHMFRLDDPCRACASGRAPDRCPSVRSARRRRRSATAIAS